MRDMRYMHEIRNLDLRRVTSGGIDARGDNRSVRSIKNASSDEC